MWCLMSGCQRCNLCLGTCNSCQSFCQVGAQRVGSFSFNQCVRAGEQFLTKDNWNRLIKYINDAYARGALRDGGDSGLPSNNKDPYDYMTEEMFNDVSYALRHLGSTYANLSVEKGDVILGSYFTDLEDYANYLEYKYSQCDVCNVSCNTGCDSGRQAIYCCSSCNAGNS